MGNRRPILAASRVELAGPPRKMGEGDRHLALSLRQYGVTIRAVASTGIARVGCRRSALAIDPDGLFSSDAIVVDWQRLPA